MNTKEMHKQDWNYSNNTELLEREDIKDSPFHIIGVENEQGKKAYFGVVGKYRITEPKPTKKEIETKLSKITWNRIVQVVLILMEQQEQNKKLINKATKEPLKAKA